MRARRSPFFYWFLVITRLALDETQPAETQPTETTTAAEP